MTARDILRDKVHEARRFRYIADDDGTGDALARLMQDVWDTAEEFESRGGGDCDGWSLWTAQRGHETAGAAEWRAVAGLVRQRGLWLGHMWCSVVDEQGEVWADPTWGLDPAEPEWLGYPDTRMPVRRWTHKGLGHFDDQHDYQTAPAAVTAALAAGPAGAFLSPLDVRKVAAAEWELLTPLRFQSAVLGGEVVAVPAGARTDFASVPRAPFAYLLAGNTGHEAAVVHDWCYRQGLYTREIADDVFAEALMVLGEPQWRVALMYHAVRLFGADSYRRTTA